MVKVSDMWQETCLVAITRKGGSDVNFAAKSDDLGFGGAERDIDLKTMLNGSNKVVLKPMTLKEVNMKIYAVEIDEVDQLFMGDVADVTQPLSVTNVLNRYEFRFAALWCDKTTAVNATEAVDGSKAGYRTYAVGGFMTKCEEFWEGTEYGLNVTIKFPPYQSGATITGNLTRESTDGTATMTALAAYS